MIDSGATSSFINNNFVKDNDLPLDKKPSPIPLYVIDGRPIVSGEITHNTIPLNLLITNHSEEITLDVIQLGTYPIVLGLPWLKKHNPTILWREYHILFKNKYCKKNCISESAILEETDDKILALVAPQQYISATQLTRSSDESETEINLSKLPIEYSDFVDVFSKESSKKLPPHRPYDHRIPLLPDSQPPFGPIYPLSEIELKELKSNLKENLDHGFICPSSSPAGAPILFVKKKDGSLRLVVDYRGLNKITIKNRYPLPLIGELLDRLKTAKIFSTIDLRGAYNLVRVAEGEEWKTAFRTRYGHYEYQVMPFGLTNAPASFQHFINDIFSDILDNYVVVYLDDILVFSNNKEDHTQHVREVLQRLRNNSLFGKLEKSNFHNSSAVFLGYIVSSNGIKMDPEKVEAVLSWPTPKCVKDIQSFIGFANFYHRFIKDFSKIVTPLTQLTKQNVKWSWNDSTQHAFDTLKTAFTSAPILNYFNPKLPITVETDASDFAIGAIISQKDEKGLLHPIAFYSRKFTPAELNYEIYDKELLGIVEAFRVWRAYLEGAQHQITVITDHKNLEYFTTTKVLNRRQARWSEILGNYDFIIKYVSGTLNGKPDALSRRSDYHPKEGDNTIEGQILIKPDQLTIAATSTELTNHDLKSEIINSYNDDPFTKDLIKYFKNPKLKKSNEIKQSIKNYDYKNDFILTNGLILIPDKTSIKLKILHDHHDSPTAGHYGQAKTYELISRNYFWPQMRSFINEYISTCDQCKRCKASRHKPFGYLQSLPVAKGPWKSISMDFIVSLPESNKFTAILVIVDRFTKMSHFIPTTNEVNATTTAQLFFDHIYKYHGLPTDIISDCGTVFTSKFWSTLMGLINVKTNLSTSFHPQTDGQTERINQILETYI